MNSRPGRDFDDRPPRRHEQRFDADDGPRRTFSRRTEESGSGRAGESDDDWRTGPTRKLEESSSEVRPERRSSRRQAPEEDREEVAADREDDWRAGSSSRPSAFADRRNSRRDQEEESNMGPRRFSSRADNEDWRRPGVGASSEEASRVMIDRTKSVRASAPTVRGDVEDDWRTATSSSAKPTPWGRRRSEEETTPSKPPQVVKKTTAPVIRTPSTVKPKGWSSSEDEAVPVIVKPDLEKINKFASKIDSYAQVSVSEDVGKKIDSLIKKIPSNFGKAELASLEPMRAVLLTVLKSENNSADDVDRLIHVISPVVIALEQQYLSFGGAIEEFQMNILEEVQKFVASIGCPRLTAETALVEQIWLSLYESRAVCEEIFAQWLENEDSFDSPNKSTTLFQTEAFRAWIYEKELPGVVASAPVAVEEKDEWESSDEDSDIEALVPKRISGAQIRLGAVAPLRR